MYKLNYYVPLSAKEETKQALFNIGAGTFSNYECCAWETLGTGQFRPIKNANPTIGQVDMLEILGEYKIEMICKDGRVLMKSIIFVCLGNICRSPIAEGCAKKIVEEKKLNLKIESAGTGSWHVGEAPCDNSIKVCKSHDINISEYKGSQFKKVDTNSYDLVVALDDSNYNDLKVLGVSNLVKLGDYGYQGADVPDPYFFDGFKGFDKVYEMINTCVGNLLNEVKI